MVQQAGLISDHTFSKTSDIMFKIGECPPFRLAQQLRRQR